MQGKKLSCPDQTTKALNSLENLEPEPVEPSVLTLPQPQRTYMVSTDAIANESEAVLLPQESNRGLN